MTVLEEGVDVSRYNGVIQWPAVYQAGKRFAIVRLGSSNANGPYLDPYFNDNVKQAQAAGLRVGAYYYTYASSEEEVIGELNVLLPALEGHRLEYPVYVDVESKELAQLGRERATQLVRFAMDILVSGLSAAGGLSPLDSGLSGIPGPSRRVWNVAVFLGGSGAWH